VLGAVPYLYPFEPMCHSNWRCRDVRGASAAAAVSGGRAYGI
jgi:hypothetical protein